MAALVTELEQAIKIKCIALGSTAAASASAVTHANAAAGIKNFPLVGALNVIAGNKLPYYREHDGVLNQLAGTVGWGANAAAARWAGLL